MEFVFLAGSRGSGTSLPLAMESFGVDRGAEGRWDSRASGVAAGYSMSPGSTGQLEAVSLGEWSYGGGGAGRAWGALPPARAGAEIRNAAGPVRACVLRTRTQPLPSPGAHTGLTLGQRQGRREAGWSLQELVVWTDHHTGRRARGPLEHWDGKE